MKKNNQTIQVTMIGVFAALTLIAYFMGRVFPIRFTFIVTTVFALIASDMFGKWKGFRLALSLAVTSALLTILMDGDLIHPLGILTDYSIPFAITALAALLPKKNAFTIIPFAFVAFFVMLMSMYITWAVAWFGYDWDTQALGSISFSSASWNSFWSYQIAFVIPTLPTIALLIVAPYEALKITMKGHLNKPNHKNRVV